MTICSFGSWPKIAAVLILAGGLAVTVAAPARANVDFNFNVLAATGATCTGGDCVLSSASQSFSTGGITLGAYSYAASGGGGVSGPGTDVSQRFGTNGGSETGLGVFTHGVDKTTGSSLEISAREYLLLDNSNAIAQGYVLSSLSLSSIQSGEGGGINVYSASTIGNTLTLSKLTLIAALTNPGTGSAPIQTYDFNPTNDTADYIVVTADNAVNTPTGNVLLAQEIFSKASTSSGPAPVPEPSTLLLYGTFVLGLAVTAWRRRSLRAGLR